VTRRRHERRYAPVAVTRRRFQRAPARYVAVEPVVREKLELPQNLIARLLLVHRRALECENHVTLRPWRQIELPAVLPDALVAFQGGFLDLSSPGGAQGGLGLYLGVKSGDIPGVPFLFRLFKNRAIEVIEDEVRFWIEKARAGELAQSSSA
jgi:hypothetical protein